MATPVFHREKAAQIITESVIGGIQATCDKYGITRRTLERWKKRLEQGDTELSDRVASKMSLLERDWAEELPGAIREAIGFLKRASEEADCQDPDAIRSVAGALKILTDVTMGRRILDARLAKANAGIPRQDGPSGEAPEEGDPDDAAEEEEREQAH